MPGESFAVAGNRLFLVIKYALKEYGILFIYWLYIVYFFDLGRRLTCVRIGCSTTARWRGDSTSRSRSRCICYCSMSSLSFYRSRTTDWSWSVRVPAETTTTRTHTVPSSRWPNSWSDRSLRVSQTSTKVMVRPVATGKSNINQSHKSNINQTHGPAGRYG